MRKRIAQPNRSGQVSGAIVIIKEVHNDTLRESATIVNNGTIAQPLRGWMLATLRAEKYYAFPDGLVLLPRMAATIHSGQGTSNNSSDGLLWTEEQLRNSQGDGVVPFDANGLEVDSYTYPHERILGTNARPRKMLLYEGGTWCMVDGPADPRLKR